MIIFITQLIAKSSENKGWGGGGDILLPHMSCAKAETRRRRT